MFLVPLAIFLMSAKNFFEELKVYGLRFNSSSRNPLPKSNGHHGKALFFLGGGAPLLAMTCHRGFLTYERMHQTKQRMRTIYSCWVLSFVKKAALDYWLLSCL